ncbi:MAG: GNAT family N-acetyltransferase [Lysobacteraceae bacterium]|nr:MAG: GNAT family N-acetyltransferase [Xanthomonadaceae bacterium]
MIRDARLPGDEPAILSFIQGLQDYELQFEANRSRDPGFVAEHWRDAQHRCAEKHGTMLVAEDGGKPVGWAFAYEEHGELFIAAPERRHGFLAEIYVQPEARGQGHGRALIEAVEAWSRGRAHKLLTIGVLAGNARAIRSYEGAGYAPYTIIMRRYL